MHEFLTLILKNVGQGKKFTKNEDFFFKFQYEFSVCIEFNTKISIRFPKNEEFTSPNDDANKHTEFPNEFQSIHS